MKKNKRINMGWRYIGLICILLLGIFPVPSLAESTNIILNPGFEPGTASWLFYTNGAGTFLNDVPGATSPSAGHITISLAGTNVQLYQAGLVLEPNTLYNMSFKAYSNSGHDLSISIFKHGAPYTNYGLSEYAVNLGTSWTDYLIQFTTSGFSGTVNDGRLMFMLAPYGTSGNEYFFDDVVISKFSSYTPPPPATPPAITSQPSSRTVITGQAAAFSVTATGTAPLDYQWKKDSVNISSATGPSYTTPATSLADNATKFSVVVSNLYGSITSNEVTLSVIDTPSVQWWDTARRFRVPVTVGSTGFERYEKPVDVSVNFTRELNGLGQAGAFDENSLRVVETDSTGIVLDDMVPFQFDKDTGYNAAGKASGTIVFIMKGTTQPSMIRYYHIYFDTAGGSFTPLSVTPLVTLTDNINDEGQSSYRIQANGSTYYYQKAAGGFSSLVDSSGNDWISYAPVVGSAEYRGIPNVYSGGIFHPGFTCCTSSIVTQGPLKVSVRSVSPAGWENRWDFYPGYATMTMVRAPAGYYFLYEGTPGGALEPNSDFMVRSDGTQNLLSQSWNVDIPNNEWAYFSDPNVARSLFAAHHEDDTLPDTYWPYNTNVLTVFGFGRTDYPATGWLPNAVPQHFTIGLMNGTGFTQNSKIIYSAYKDLAISTSMAEQYNNILPPAIVTQPADQIVREGQTATFSVEASGASPLAYQWQKNGVDIQDANLATYATPAITSADDGDRFMVVVSNILGSVTSNEAILTVDVSIPPPPANQLVLLDATFEHNTTVSLLPPLNAITGKSATFFNIPPNVPDNLISPIDYAHGTIYQRLEVFTKPSTKTVWYQICIFQDEITTLRHACTFREQLAFNSPGIYYQSQPFSTVFQYYNNDWSRKLLIYMLTMTDTNHVLIDDRPGYNFGKQWIGYPDMTLYYPMKVRYTAILIPSGGGQPVWPSDQVVSRPQVVTKAPTGTNVPVASRININFSKAMNKTSAESAFSTLPAITGSFSWSGNNMTYTPVSDLAYSTIYKVTVGTGAKDLAGINMSSKYEWQFTTKDQDLTPPTVIGNSPTGTDVSRAAKISVTFSEEMNRSSAQSAFSTLPDTTGGSFSWNGNMMTYTPATNLAYSTTYTVTVGTGAMDISGNTMSSPNVSQFITKDQDLTPPAVIDNSPTGTGVPIASKVTVTFSEEMNTSSAQSAFSILPAIAGSFSWSGNMMTYTPVSNLAYNTTYIVTVGTGAMDISGNNLPSPNVSQFTTIPDMTPPSVTGNTPTGTNVPVVSSITVNFSEAMDIASVESAFFTLPDTTGGSFSWSGNTMRYTPPSNLSYNTTYSVRIATGAKDLAGNNLPAEFVWQFTTAPLSINVLSNAGFESGTTSWLFYTSGTGTFSVISPGYEGNAARLALNSGGTNIQLFQTGITVEPNTRYRLSFTAYSTTGHDVIVRLFKHGSPYTAYSPEFTINLGTSWQAFTTEFTSSGITGTVKDGRLMFQVSPFAAAGDIYYLDNIKLEKV